MVLIILSCIWLLHAQFLIDCTLMTCDVCIDDISLTLSSITSCSWAWFAFSAAYKNTTIGAFTSSGFGVRRLQTYFQLFLLKSAPWKARFYKPCTSTASENEFDHRNRILRLKVGVSVYTVSRISRCQGRLPIAFLFYGRFTGHFVVTKQAVKQTAQLFCPWQATSWERTTLMRPKPLRF